MPRISSAEYQRDAISGPVSLIEIETGVPMPTTRRRGRSPSSESSRIGEALLRMGRMQSFKTQVSSNHVYSIALRFGVRIRTEKLAKGGFRVWRVA